MKEDIEVALEGLEFFAYHGLYEEETKTGNRFIVDVKVNYPKINYLSDDISEVVDYVKLFQIVKLEMEVPSKLLEVVAQKIVDAIFNLYPNITSAEATVSKMNPPLGSLCKKSKVTIRRIND
ncbi:dihydroneopterin aldolase [Sporocytophaga myxococcoides]|uniref:7,8-dihydroneopterin aldolase n=1 Tax=Sporocytophaga myxococcoides TaxID=153721 RepID=A0A098L9K9_9BACT|nr:dihydroneopterin aldolase [Sporocytophaga myxococcoides]GAL82803.1 dihydroneopterin aldolase [Sporocytophaga myxococcoides]